MWDLSSPTRDWTCVPCTGRQILNHWTNQSPPNFLLLRFWLKDAEMPKQSYNNCDYILHFFIEKIPDISNPHESTQWSYFFVPTQRMLDCSESRERLQQDVTAVSHNSRWWCIRCGVNHSNRLLVIHGLASVGSSNFWQYRCAVCNSQALKSFWWSLGLCGWAGVPQTGACILSPGKSIIIFDLSLLIWGSVGQMSSLMAGLLCQWSWFLLDYGSQGARGPSLAR